MIGWHALGLRPPLTQALDTSHRWWTCENASANWTQELLFGVPILGGVVELMSRGVLEASSSVPWPGRALLILTLGTCLVTGCDNSADYRPPATYPAYPVHQSSPSWSAGGSIAYQDHGIVCMECVSPIEQVDTSLVGVWVLDPSTGARQRILSDGANPDWSSDGTRLACDRFSSIYICDANGAGAYRVASGTNPAWSPDSEWIACVRHSGIYVVSPDGSTERWIYHRASRDPNWHPQGGVLIFACDGTCPSDTATVGGILQHDLQDSTTVVLKRLPAGALLHSPRYSPDGLHIAYVSSETGHGEVWIMGKDGSGSRQLTQNGGNSPSWSPDGRRIVYLRKNWLSESLEDNVLWVIDVETEEESQLTSRHAASFRVDDPD